MSTTSTDRKVDQIDSQVGAQFDELTKPVVAVRRRTIDKIMIGIGVVATGAFVVAGSLLAYGANFSDDYVHDELSSQNISFPDAESLNGEGRADLVKYAGEQVTTGPQAEAYASFINGHLEGIADGQTYADLGTVERAAKAAVTEAVDNGQPQTAVDELQNKADGVTAQRDSLFKGETLRGLLLTAFAWSTVGMIAGYRSDRSVHRRRNDGGAGGPRVRPPAEDSRDDLIVAPEPATWVPGAFPEAPGTCRVL